MGDIGEIQGRYRGDIVETIQLVLTEATGGAA